MPNNDYRVSVHLLTFVGFSRASQATLDIALRMGYTEWCHVAPHEIDRHTADFWRSAAVVPTDYIPMGRKQVLASLRRICPQVQLQTLVASTAIVSRFATIGGGCIISTDAIINPLAVLCEGTLVGARSVIEHDALIGPYANVGDDCAFGGNVTIHEGAVVDNRCTINHGLTLEANCCIESDTAVIASVPQFTRVKGLPGRHI